MFSNWFKRRKVRKSLDLQLEADRLQSVYQQYLNTLCLFKGQIVVFMGFRVEDEKIVMLFQDNLSVRIGLFKTIDANVFDFTFGFDEIRKSRMRFLKLKLDITDFGFTIEKMTSINNV